MTGRSTLGHSPTIERSTNLGHPNAVPWALGRITLVAATAACAAILLLKVVLAWRINVNWDEFYFLSHVHALRRGELDLLFQATHAHVFRWLAAFEGEMNQVIAARLVMLFLLAVTCLLIFRLARRWMAPRFAIFAPLAYLASFPVLLHGGSFRYDSMLAPLTLVVLLLQTRAPVKLRYAVIAGGCFGLMVVISLKAVLLLPVIATLALLGRAYAGESGRATVAEVARFLIAFGIAAAMVAGVLWLAHSLTLAPRAQDAGAVASGIVRKSLLDIPFAPRAGYFLDSWQSDKGTWLLVIGGLFAAIARRKVQVLALGLSLLPILFYRNAFPYYYVLMLAPACVLAALAIESIATLPNEVLSERRVMLVHAIIAATLMAQAGAHLFYLREDAQARQREVLAGVHAIFPQPVPYIDHSGMVATFPKANFFMSTWGLENYRARGQGFVREALHHKRPPLFLVNRLVLDPRVNSAGLLPEDRRLLRESYLQYWGPVWVAGTEVRLAPGALVVAKLPFPGSYRLVTDEPVQVNGVERHDGDTIAVTADSQELRVQAGVSTTIQEAKVRFVWAAARAAPSTVPPEGSLYRPLGKQAH